MRVVYADTVFILNFAVDWLITVVTARLAGVRVPRLRRVVTALLGAVYAVLAAVFGGFWDAAAVRLLVGAGLAALCFPGVRRAAGLWLAVACGFAGAASLGLWPGLLASAAVGLIFLDGFARHRVRRELVRVRVSVSGRIAEFTALVDTGNALTDPLTGLPVTVCDGDCLAGLELPALREICVSTASGAAALRCFTPEELIIGGVRTEGVIAISKGRISTGRGYSALTHAEAA